MSERLWPETLEFVSFLEQVTGEASVALLTMVWKGCDLLMGDLATIRLSEPFADLERDLTQQLEKRIRRVMTGFEAFEIQHGPYERESRKPPPAQPPQYDPAFSLRTNERVMWPIEAKVLVDAGGIGEYARDVQEEYLTCRYSPFQAKERCSAIFSPARQLTPLTTSKPDSSALFQFIHLSRIGITACLITPELHLLGNSIPLRFGVIT